jgi:hypothetical protein
LRTILSDKILVFVSNHNASLKKMRESEKKEEGENVKAWQNETWERGGGGGRGTKTEVLGAMAP